MLHVETFNMSNLVALSGRSTCNERTCDRNTHEPFLNRTQARLAPKPPILESRHMCERSRKFSSLTITHNNQTIYQTIHFKHNNNITWTRTVLGNDRIPSTTPGAEPPRDVRDSGSARSHSTYLETTSSDRP